MSKWHKTQEQKLISPCIHYCNFIEGMKMCGGCFRTDDEIRAWRNLDEDARKAILKETYKRQQNHQGATDSE